jgi:hypothetical protein
MIRKSREKATMLPLCAQEVEFLRSTEAEFRKWFTEVEKQEMPAPGQTVSLNVVESGSSM